MGRGRPTLPAEPWYEEVIWYMVREDVNFTQACQALGVKFNSGKAEESHQNRKSFRDMFWRIKNTYLQNIGGDPTLTKEAAMGALWQSTKNMQEKGDHDKVATAIQVLAKMAGWLKEDTQPTVFATLSQTDIDEIKKKIQAKMVLPSESASGKDRDLPS